jgi:hypothetical protein
VRATLVGAVMAGVLQATAAPVGAQAGSQAPSQPNPPGWVFTPGIAVAETWDNNVLLATEGSGTTEDFLTAVSPRGALTFRGRRSTFNLDYQGSFQLYRELSQLDAFEQRGSVDFRRRLSPSVTFFARNSLSKSPTTDDVDLPGIRFRRQGVLLDDLRTGIDAKFGQRTSLETAYTLQWVEFESPSLTTDLLRQGGLAQGIAADIEHALGPRISIGAEVDTRHASMTESGDFNVHNALATAAWKLGQRLALEAGAGYSWLSAPDAGEDRSAPAVRVNLNGSGSRFGWDVGYERTFLPAFGFGGTFQNQELRAGFLARLNRRLDWNASVALQQNEPLGADPLRLRTLWTRSSLSYLTTPWLRVEGFCMAALQDSRRPGGRVDRVRAGVQVVTFKRMRMQ